MECLQAASDTQIGFRSGGKVHPIEFSAMVDTSGLDPVAVSVVIDSHPSMLTATQAEDVVRECIADGRVK